MPELTPRHQAIRTLLAGIDNTQFAALKATLEQSRAAIDARLAVLDAESEQLALRREQLETLLEHVSKPDGLERLRSTMLKGERLGAKGTKPKDPRPARRPARTRTSGGSTPRD